MLGPPLPPLQPPLAPLDGSFDGFLSQALDVAGAMLGLAITVVILNRMVRLVVDVLGDDAPDAGGWEAAAGELAHTVLVSVGQGVRLGMLVGLGAVGLVVGLGRSFVGLLARSRARVERRAILPAQVGATIDLSDCDRDSRVCLACRAWSPHDARFCIECGHTLERWA